MAQGGAGLRDDRKSPLDLLGLIGGFLEEMELGPELVRWAGEEGHSGGRWLE